MSETPPTSLTICAACRFFLKQGGLWYQQFCSASPREHTIDVVTGEEGFRATNDLGQNYITNHPYHYAREINNGQCSLYCVRK